jgi:hypothetical protein
MLAVCQALHIIRRTQTDGRLLRILIQDNKSIIVSHWKHITFRRCAYDITTLDLNMCGRRWQIGRARRLRASTASELSMYNLPMVGSLVADLPVADMFAEASLGVSLVDSPLAGSLEVPSVGKATSIGLSTASFGFSLCC